MNDLRIPNLTPDQALLFKGFNIAQNEAERVKNAIEKIEEQELIYTKKMDVTYTTGEAGTTQEIQIETNIPREKIVNISFIAGTTAAYGVIKQINNYGVTYVNVTTESGNSGVTKTAVLYILYKK